MNQLTLLTNLKKLGKPAYSFSDFQLILGLSKLSTNKRIIDLVNQGVVTKLSKNLFIPTVFDVNIEKIASQLYQPNYISFESALAFHNVLSFESDVLTMASLNKSITRELGTTTVVWTRMRKELFFGMENINDLMIASPEKAICDLLYLVSVGKAKLEKDDIKLELINKDKIFEILKIYPESTKSVANKLFAS